MNEDRVAIDPDLFLRLIEHKVDSVRVDRTENLRSIAYITAGLSAFLAFLNFPELEALNQTLLFSAFELRWVAIASACLAALGIGIVWFYTRALHEAELRITANATDAIANNTLEAINKAYGTTWRLWTDWRLLHKIGYISLSSAAALLFVYFIAGVF